MKSLRKLFVLALLAVSMTAAAQDEMTKAVMDYVKACPSSIVGMDEKMGEALKLLNQELIKNYNGKTSEELVSNYMKTQFLNDMVECMLVPCVKEFVTVDELKQITAVMSSREGKLFQEHQKKLNESANFEEIGKSLMETIIAGQEPEDIKPNPTCPKSYVSTFNKYYEGSGLNSVVDQMGNMFGDKKDDPSVQKLIAFLKKNMQTIYLNGSYGTMTMDDLKFGIKMFQTDAWKHIMQSQNKLMSDARNLGMTIVLSYVLWLAGQDVELKDM